MKNSEQYLLSILIPTKDRQFYCAFAVKQIYYSTDNRVQIVVQDNSEDNTLKSLIEQEKYSERVEYYYIRDVIPCSENYNVAISHAKGTYACSIGDDDGILPQIVDLVEFAKKHNINAIHPNVGSIYYWPSVSGDSEGKLIIGRHEPTFRFANPKQALEDLLHEGCQNYMKMNLVKGYHGIVRKSFFDQVYNITGKYCGALSSDMFMCVTLSLIVESVLVIDHPITISGACRKSTSGDSINNINFGKLESAPHFVGQEYYWSDLVPAFYSSNTIWADSALHAFEEMGRKDLLAKFNVEILSAICTFKYPDYENYVLDNLRKNNRNMNVYRKHLLQLRQKQLVNNIKKRILTIINSVQRQNKGVQSIFACSDIVEAATITGKQVEISFKELMMSLEKYIQGKEMYESKE